ncbi:MAG: lycopene cyclase domain-containing protein [Bacteroidia bacterium]|nr:lycopene cyclase domain-containing protein [Bacteroidia bacterium]NND12134.1 lycopene cyclase domain-containing protein [Flavobacteriaceae bacterium]
MNYLYLLLDLGSLSIPFLFSFHPKLKFYKKWKALFFAIPLTMLIFIPWDVIFTEQGFWGFNDTYFLNKRLLGLPIEEWLFFICIPYACVFTHYALLYYFPKIKLNDTVTKTLTFALIALFIIMIAINHDKWYTFINFSYAFIMLPIVFYFNNDLLKSYYVTFLVMLIPFFIVNGILTGSFIEDQVVWYSDSEIIGIRLFTIPIEDTVYAFTMILTNLVLVEYLQKKFSAIK